MRPGEAFLGLAVLVWLSIAVGPWWVGVVLFLVGLGLNLIPVKR